VDGCPTTQRELAGLLVKHLGARVPKSVEVDAYARLSGDLAAESWSCSVRVSADKMKRHLLPELKFASCEDGMPHAIESMGILHREERAA